MQLCTCRFVHAQQLEDVNISLTFHMAGAMQARPPACIPLQVSPHLEARLAEAEGVSNVRHWLQLIGLRLSYQGSLTKAKEIHVSRENCSLNGLMEQLFLGCTSASVSTCDRQCVQVCLQMIDNVSTCGKNVCRCRRQCVQV